jgi:hypothetical protein
MMIPLLAACGGQTGGSEAEELALTIRGEYLAAQTCSGSGVVTADYGQRVYRYEMDFSADEGETVLTLTGPETVAGLTARLESQEDSILEYDGAVLETGPLDADGLTPVAAIPALLTALREGYLDSCTLEDEDGGQVLRLLVRDPEADAGSGVETTLWLDGGTHALLRGEISRDGFCVIQCEFSNFSKS